MEDQFSNDEVTIVVDCQGHHRLALVVSRIGVGTFDEQMTDSFDLGFSNVKRISFFLHFQILPVMP